MLNMNIDWGDNKLFAKLEEVLVDYYNKEGIEIGDITPELEVIYDEHFGNITDLFIRLKEINK